MGVPKTIDNDLDKTDHTPGYGSAAKYVASAMKEIILDTDTYTTDSITIVEIMGRNAGWLTASAALARTEDCTKVFDLIYLPETPFSYDKFVSDILEVKSISRLLLSHCRKVYETPTVNIYAKHKRTI